LSRHDFEHAFTSSLTLTVPPPMLIGEMPKSLCLTGAYAIGAVLPCDREGDGASLP
jgi:hypothetical protein